LFFGICKIILINIKYTFTEKYKMSVKCFLDKLILKFVLIIFLIFLINSKLIAQSYTAKLYNENAGLFQKNISDIITDADGFLWLSTESGLVRFDGNNFNEFFPKELRYKKLGPQKLKKYQNGVFLNFEKNGCLYFDFNTYQFKQIIDEPIFDIQPIAPNTLIVLTQKGWLKKIINGVVRFQIRIQAQEGSILTIFKGYVYVSLPKVGIISFNSKDLKVEKVINKIIPNGYKNSFEICSNKLILVSDSKVYSIAEGTGKREQFKFLGRNFEENISNYKYYNKKNQFIFVNNKYIAKVLPNELEKLSISDIINCELISMHFIDSNNIFIGTGQGLLLISKDDKIPLKIDDNISFFENTLRIRRSILEIKSGELLLMGHPNNLIYKNKRFEILGNGTKSYNQAILSGDYVYTAVDLYGFQKINVKNGKIEQLALNKNKETYISVYLDTINNRILAGGIGYIAIHDIKSGKTNVLDIFKNKNTIRTILFDDQTKKYWIGTSNGLFVCNQNFKSLTAISTPIQDVITGHYSALLMPFGRNEIWVAHDNGVTVYNRKSQRSLRDLPNQIFNSHKIVSLIEDNYHRIWMGTYIGFIGFDPQNNEYIRLTSKNKLFNTEFNFNSATKISNGNLIFGGLSGYDVINPTLYTFEKTINFPKVTGYNIYSTKDTVFAKYNQEDLSINFEKQYLNIFVTTTNLIEFENSIIEYRIDDGPWVENKNHSVISIIKINPGKHKLYIRSFDEYGRISEMKPLEIFAFIDFYNSRAFLWGLIILVFTGFALFTYANLSKNLIEKKTKENIAMDLHDEVGTMLTRALYLLKIENKEVESNATTYLNDALFSLRVYINTMNKSTFEAIRLSDEINELASSILGPDRIRFYSNLSSFQNIEIKNALFRDIKLCIFEALNNIQKHAKANLVIIHLMVDARQITLKVIDNGSFNGATLDKSQGNGIQNIKKRVARNHGFVKFEQNTQGNGLQIVFTFPIN
jgi:hypothetical protein